MSDCRFGVSPVNYPDPDPVHFIVNDINDWDRYHVDVEGSGSCKTIHQLTQLAWSNEILEIFFLHSIRKTFSCSYVYTL